MKQMTKLGALMGAALLGGCATVAEITVGFDPNEVAWASRTGTATIEGQAFLRQVGGDVVTAAGSPVLLCPDSAFGRQINAAAEADHRTPEGGIPGADAYASTCRQTTADASGGFIFTDLPAGTYSVGAEVEWSAPYYGLYYAGLVPQGGYVYEIVSVAAGQTVRVIVTR